MKLTRETLLNGSMLALNREQGTTLILVTHDAAIAQHASRIVTMRDGSILSDSGAGSL